MEKEEEQKAVFEIWLAAYNSRLVQVAQGSPGTKARVPAQSADEEGFQPDPSSGNNP